MSRSIRDLQPQAVLALAVAVESRNAERYATFAHLFSTYNDEASRLFDEMREEELAHRAVLLRLYRDRYGDQEYPIDEADVDEVVEAVDLDEAEHMVFNDITRRHVFEAALRAEQGARGFYASLTGTVQDPALLALYRQLAEYEEDHVAALEARMSLAGIESGGGNNGHHR
ncbi:MAG TPA: ferritin family protein [Chthonomonadaceae bacterium]|nr:ferritin family protein [Chthonomonadaceae bacterium]